MCWRATLGVITCSLVLSGWRPAWADDCGFTVTDVPLAAGATNTHEWYIPATATKVYIDFTLAGSVVRLRMKEGTAPGGGDPWFEIPPGVWHIIFPDLGMPFTPGHNFITVSNLVSATTYTMTAWSEPCLHPVCGNGLVADPEGCDDGAAEDGDGCSSACTIENGFICQGEPSVCYSSDIPTVSEWGLVAMTLLVLTAGTVVLRRPRAVRA